MIFPLPGHENDWHDTFGACRPLVGPGAGSCTRRHEGQDISAPLGTPLLAVTDGTASRTSSGAGGQGVNIDTADGYRFYYAHLGSYSPNVPVGGGPVKEGDVVGYVGMTGQTTGPHLHFGVYRNGAAINPAPFLTGAQPGKALQGDATGGIGLDDIPQPIGIPGIPFIPGLDLGDIPNPFDTVDDLAGAVKATGELLLAPAVLVTRGLAWIANRDNWSRIAQVSAGITLIGLGGVVMFRDVLADAATVSLNPAGAVTGLTDDAGAPE